MWFAVLYCTVCMVLKYNNNTITMDVFISPLINTGTVTAANASGISDGAGALIVATEEAVRQRIHVV